MIHQITCRKQSIAEKIIMFLSRNLDVGMINKMAKKYDRPAIFYRFMENESALVSKLYHETVCNSTIHRKIDDDINNIVSPVYVSRWSLEVMLGAKNISK